MIFFGGDLVCFLFDSCSTIRSDMKHACFCRVCSIGKSCESDFEMMKLFFKVRTLAKSYIDFLFLYVRSVWKTRLKTKIPRSDFCAHHNAIKIFDEPTDNATCYIDVYCFKILPPPMCTALL